MTKIQPIWQIAVLVLLLGLILPVRAQREYFNWYFGLAGRVSFNTLPPQAIAGPRLSLPYCPGSISDAAGRLQFITDGVQAWDTTGTLLAGWPTRSCSLFPAQANYHEHQMTIPQPGRPGRYVVVCGTATQASNSTCVLTYSYSIVDMRANNGRGAVVESQRLPGTLPYFYFNGFAAARHANGRDVWVITQNYLGQYFAWLLTATGWASAPVVSETNNRSADEYESRYQLKVSPDGRRVASVLNRVVPNSVPATTYKRLVMANFSTTTGRVSSPMVIDSLRTQATFGYVLLGSPSPNAAQFGGLEFSPDGTRLYADTVGSRAIWQYNLLAGSPATIAASRLSIQIAGQNAALGEGVNGLQLGPDGNIYVSSFNSAFLGQLTNTNASAPAVSYNATAVNLQGGQCYFSFPKPINDLNLTPVVISGPGSLAAVAGCAGQPLQFSSSLSPFITATSYMWDFDDLGSGPANEANGQAPTHVFSQGGSFHVTLRLTSTSGQQFAVSQTVVVNARPLVALGNDTLLCNGSQRTLNAGPQPAGSSYRWQDGSTATDLLATKSGLYWVEVTNSVGCKTKSSLQLVTQNCPNPPNIITPNGDAQNQAFVIKGLNASDWSIHLYSRWGREIFAQAKYDNSWAAQGQPDGVYYYLLTNAQTSQKYKGWVEVKR